MKKESCKMTQKTGQGLSRSRIERRVNGLLVKTLQDDYGRFNIRNIGLYSA